MKKPAVLAAVFATALLAGPALADDFPSAISVSGEASVTAAPDLAQIDAGVANDAKTAKEASDANNAAMGKVLLALKGAGIAEKDYQTSRLSLQPQYGQNKSTGASPVVGFRASNRVTVKLRDVTKVASIIDTLVSAGANVRVHAGHRGRRDSCRRPSSCRWRLFGLRGAASDALDTHLQIIG